MKYEQDPSVHIVGGGLAGCEAAYQCLLQGLKVVLHEMRPYESTGAHTSGALAELVCSNSLKSESMNNASGLLKYEMFRFQSLTLKAAALARVPAGEALAVDRELFSESIEDSLKSFQKFYVRRERITHLPESQGQDVWILATGPLTEQSFITSLPWIEDDDQGSYFYDAIAPIIAAESIDYSRAFWGARWKKDGSDYLNIPLTNEQYQKFVIDILSAEKVPLRKFENPCYFESCLPIEVMAERGMDTLRFGPLKPVGLTLPGSDELPYAVVQLRRENMTGSMLNMVGFQTKMKWSEQKRIFRSLPGLEAAEFLRFGSIHRNTYLNGPKLLNPNLSFKKKPDVFAAGQITGVEGYMESALMGILAGRAVSAQLLGRRFLLPPPTTMSGALLAHVITDPLMDYQPMNANTGLLPSVRKTRGESKVERKTRQINLAKNSFELYAVSLAESLPQKPAMGTNE